MICQYHLNKISLKFTFECFYDRNDREIMSLRHSQEIKLNLIIDEGDNGTEISWKSIMFWGDVL